MGGRWAKILAALLAFSALALVAGLAGVWALGQSDWGRQRLRAYLVQEAQTRAGLTLDMGQMSGNLLTNLEIDDLSLARPGQTLLTVRRVELSYSPLALLGGRLSLGHLRLLGPRGHLPAGLALPGGGEAAGPGLWVTIGRLEIRDGGLEVAPGALPGPWERLRSLEQVNLNGHFRLDTRGPFLLLDLAGAQARLADQPEPLSLAGRARLRQERLELSPVSLGLGDNRLELKGQVAWRHQPAVELEVRGSLGDLSPLSLPGLGWGRPKEPLPLALELKGDAKSCKLAGLLGSAAQGLDLKGQASLETSSLTLEAKLHALDLEAWGLSAQPGILEGGLSLAAQGWPGQPGASASLHLDLNNPGGPALGVRRLSLEASQQGDQVKVSHLSLEGEAGSLEGSAQLTLPRPGHSLAGQGQASFHDLTPPPVLAGRLPQALRQARLQGTLSAKGDAQNLDIDLDLGPSRLLAELPFGHLAAKGGRVRGQWRLTSLELAADWAQLKAKGQAGLESGDLEFDLNLPALARLAPLWAALGLAKAPASQGSLSAQGKISGPWQAPALNLTAKGGQLELPKAYLESLALELSTPRLGLPPQGSLRLGLEGLRGGGIAWQRVEASASAGPEGLRLDLKAQGPQMSVSLQAKGKGQAQLPVRLQLTELSFSPRGGGVWSLRGPAGLDLAPHALGLQGLRLAHEGQSLSLSAQVGAGGQLQGELRTQDLRPAELWPGLPLPARARLDLESRLGGSLTAPVLDLAGVLRELAWANLPESKLDFIGAYRDGALNLRGRAQTLGRTVLEASASLGLKVSLSPPLLEPGFQSLEASAQAQDLPLALLEPFLPGASGLKGRLSLNIAASGPLAQPQVRGAIRLEGGGLTIGATGQVVKDIKLKAAIRGREISLEELSAFSGGKIWVEGRLLLPLGDPGLVDLTLNGRGFTVGLGAIGEVITDAQFHITGTPEHPVAKGWTRPSHAVIRPALAVPLAMDQIVVLEPGQEPPPLAKVARLAPRIVLGGILGDLDLEGLVEAGHGVRVDLDEGHMILGDTARVTKAPGGPLVFRQHLDILGGNLTVGGRRFSLVGGRANFADKDVPDPDMDVKVELNMGSSQIHINLLGTAFKPRLVLSSDPPMPQADMLSAIIFGRPAQALNAGETRQLSAQALALLGQGGRQEMERLVGSTLSPDVVTVHTEAQTGSSLEAGKFLSPDLYLRYRQNLGPEGGQNVGLEYRLNRVLSVESQVGNTRDSGVDAVFSWDFN